MRDDADTRLEAAVRIDEAARRLSGLIDDLLLVAEIDRGDVSADPEALELEAAIERAVAAASCTVAVRAEEWPVVFADARHLEHVLRNLLAFAGDGSVELVAAPEAARAVITLTAGGRPLDDTLFARFAPDRRSFGVGLYVAHSLAELNGGSLVVDDGSFVLELPLDPTAARA
jgi:signal transduction histidine kinase